MKTIEYDPIAWGDAWTALGNATGSRDDASSTSLEVWQYMSTWNHKEHGEVHEFRHRDRPHAAQPIACLFATHGIEATGRSTVLIRAHDLEPVAVTSRRNPTDAPKPERRIGIGSNCEPYDDHSDADPGL